MGRGGKVVLDGKRGAVGPRDVCAFPKIRKGSSSFLCVCAKKKNKKPYNMIIAPLTNF